ncbi:hypothetical protein BKA70DRAFT_1404324 [Coprinopsis sp. MPI-PUGE-AT-0042]|nr:hypothetical protein BKA70DRAFT_1404324 [Coprinopsis sp. MPI-PUGE-AT-0042]
MSLCMASWAILTERRAKLKEGSVCPDSMMTGRSLSKAVWGEGLDSEDEDEDCVTRYKTPTSASALDIHAGPSAIDEAVGSLDEEREETDGLRPTCRMVVDTRAVCLPPDEHCR